MAGVALAQDRVCIDACHLLNAAMDDVTVLLPQALGQFEFSSDIDNAGMVRMCVALDPFPPLHVDEDKAADIRTQVAFCMQQLVEMVEPFAHGRRIVWGRPPVSPDQNQQQGRMGSKSLGVCIGLTTPKWSFSEGCMGLGGFDVLFRFED